MNLVWQQKNRKGGRIYEHKMKIRMLSILLCLVMLVGLMPTTVVAVTEIHQANITITKPVGGENPDISPLF